MYRHASYSFCLWTKFCQVSAFTPLKREVNASFPKLFGKDHFVPGVGSKRLWKGWQVKGQAQDKSSQTHACKNIIYCIYNGDFNIVIETTD